MVSAVVTSYNESNLLGAFRHSSNCDDCLYRSTIHCGILYIVWILFWSW